MTCLANWQANLLSRFHLYSGKHCIVGQPLHEHVENCLSALEALAGSGSYAWTECPICRAPGLS